MGVVIRGQRNSITGLASQFAYNAFIATVPLLLLVIAAVSLVGGKDAPDRIVSTYEAQIPEAYQEALRQVLTDAVVDQNRAALFIIAGAIGALYLVGNAVGALMQGMDRARGVPHRTWLHTKIVGIKFAAIWAVLMTMVNALLLVGQDLINWATDRWNLQNDARGSLLDILFPAVALLLMVMLWVLYRYGPHAPRRRLLPLLPGILVAAVGIVGFTQLFGLYVQHFAGLSVYGGLVGVVIYLTLLWGVGVALLAGAEVNEELLAIRRGNPTRRVRIPVVDRDN